MIRQTEIKTLECKDRESKKLLNDCLWEIKPFRKKLLNAGLEEGKPIPFKMIESFLHTILNKFEFKIQPIFYVKDEQAFMFYSCGLIEEKGNVYRGTLSGKTIKELFSKIILFVYLERTEKNIANKGE